ncbi:major capsid protein [Flaviflexus massiliensis]|uniref:major capsid protein n=1 Tax=Flaviflexus massiliensis TaxID=1522309 RepID=UPI0006D5A40B|nr:major capsid protein [Flaviflexus massiliensis]
MRLWTDLINPADLTGYAREIADTYDASALSILMPTATVDDVVFSWDVDTLESLVAEYRAFDAETSIGDGGAMERKTAELAPLGRKTRFGEYERLRRRNAGVDSFQVAADKKAEALAKGVIDRINLLRGEALVNGGYTINENGFKQTVDFGRHADLTVTAATLWDVGGDPLTDIAAWVEIFETHAGTTPTHMIASAKTALALRQTITPEGGVRTASLADVNDELGANGLPQLAVVSGRVAGQRILPEDKLVMGVAGMTGGTIFGTTVEADDPRYALDGGELPGIVVGAYQEDDPATVWIRSAAIGLPILANPSMSLSATTVSA